MTVGRESNWSLRDPIKTPSHTAQTTTRPPRSPYFLHTRPQAATVSHMRADVGKLHFMPRPVEQHAAGRDGMRAGRGGGGKMGLLAGDGFVHAVP